MSYLYKATCNVQCFIIYTDILIAFDLKKEVSDFVAFLKNKSKSEKKIKERTFGYAKGFFKVADDFDEPLEDFKEYM